MNPTAFTRIKKFGRSVALPALLFFVGCASKPKGPTEADYRATQLALDATQREMAPDARSVLVTRGSPGELRFALLLTLPPSPAPSAATTLQSTWTVEHPLQRDAVLRCARPGIELKVTVLPEQSRAPGRLAVVSRDAYQSAAWLLLPIIELTRGVESQPATQPRTRNQLPGDDKSFIRLRTNEILIGEPAWVLDQIDNFALIKSSTGYIDYVSVDRISYVTEAEFFAAMNPPRSAETLSRIDRAIAHAKARLGQPYIWGGRGATGVDCSGLTQTAYASAGIHVPRDADQQSVVGKLVATRWFRDALQSGDLLFFLSAKRGDVNHVAIYLGDNRYIESADGGVTIRSMDPADPTYDAKRMSTFAWARRVLE
jgi:cell wall-associated NlpC family hydrolase